MTATEADPLARPGARVNPGHLARAGAPSARGRRALLACRLAADSHHNQGSGKNARTITMSQSSAHQMPLNPITSVRRRGCGRG